MDYEAAVQAARAPCRRCECCHYANVYPSTRTGPGYGVGCLHPKGPSGRAGVGKSCCDFEREPGTDDDLERLPPMWS